MFNFLRKPKHDSVDLSKIQVLEELCVDADERLKKAMVTDFSAEIRWMNSHNAKGRIIACYDIMEIKIPDKDYEISVLRAGGGRNFVRLGDWAVRCGSTYYEKQVANDKELIAALDAAWEMAKRL